MMVMTAMWREVVLTAVDIDAMKYLRWEKRWRVVKLKTVLMINNDDDWLCRSRSNDENGHEYYETTIATVDSDEYAFDVEPLTLSHWRWATLELLDVILSVVVSSERLFREVWPLSVSCVRCCVQWEDVSVSCVRRCVQCPVWERWAVSLRHLCWNEIDMQKIIILTCLALHRF